MAVRFKETPINHQIYAITEGFRRRGCLSDIMKSNGGQRLIPAQTNPSNLKASGVRALILDFDGVLAPHGQIEVMPEMMPWLDACIEKFGKANVFILSNKPMIERERHLSERFGVSFIRAKRKKPFTDGIDDILARTGYKPDEVMIVDDRLLTGMLAGCIAGIRTMYADPVVAMRGNFIKESAFMIIRAVERFVFGYFL